nr:YqgE/AlgH family protein [Candidatus Magnetococcus massalia]CRH08262.1 conserved protein of unknown function [Candidatus Magnetococcus massalia]
MGSFESLAGKLLIAVPSLLDAYFTRTVIYLCAHSEEGALGLVVNQPMEASVAEISQQLEIPWDRTGHSPVCLGGPVSPEQGFILFEQPITSAGSIEVSPGVHMGTNPEILTHLGRDGATERFLFVLGYAGWAEGQLEEELQENSWLVTDGDPRILFDVGYDKRWEEALHALGVDPSLLVESSGGRAN